MTYYLCYQYNHAYHLGDHILVIMTTTDDSFMYNFYFYAQIVIK